MPNKYNQEKEKNTGVVGRKWQEYQNCSVGKLKRGTGNHPTEKRLAESYAVSRMIIRQVLSQLFTDGEHIIKPY
ncbi:MAG: GntR family transcriptional regulator [Deltaproteobacteria bacterium]|nr:GntR family transcriptional regulator [Deltaproteobacteria bacterium]